MNGTGYVFRKLRYLAVCVSYKDPVDKCCGSQTICFGSGSDFAQSFGYGSVFQKVPLPDLTLITLLVLFLHFKAVSWLLKQILH
jgi:hypothetical protein